jgi:urease accessory protein UreE
MACEAMASAGALVVPMETVVYQMLKRAGTEQFKAMLPFFKA